MQYNIGITMRVTNAQNYHELRDTIAQDWPRYINYLFPEANYFFIPNIEEEAVNYCKKNNINLLIFSGGDDIGLFEKRDNTELALLEFMISNKFPVIGICRGMQLIHHYLGGDIMKGNDYFINEHRATKHKVRIKNEIITVNSYHNLKIDELTVNTELSILARNISDDSIEAFIGPKILGLMWHPERDVPFSTYTKQLIIKFLLGHE
jgi:putative glutamine amidotransferase